MDTPKGFTGPVNIGNPGEFSILQLAQKIIDLTNSDGHLTFKPLPHDDPRQRQPDIELAMQFLGWSPSIDLHNGLMQTIQYFREINSSI
jgi:UDP-glucuronate decarboxylase